MYNVNLCDVLCVCKESGEDSEVDSMSKAAGDAQIIDVTNEFVGCQDTINDSTHDGSSDAECSARREPVSSNPAVTDAQHADTECEGLSEAVGSVHVHDDFTASSPSGVEVAIVLGGMDTVGEIFDDCLVFRLTT